jgi:hypothetical protein
VSEIVERAARAIWFQRIERSSDPQSFLTYDQLPQSIVSDIRAEARDALLAALEDEAMVHAIAQRMADEATKQRNGLRKIRNGIDWANASPVSPAFFEDDARAAISALRAMVLPNEPTPQPSDEVARSMTGESELSRDQFKDGVSDTAAKPEE